MRQYKIMNADTPQLSTAPHEKIANCDPIPHNPRNVLRGIWELARLHTREAWLCWYPAGMRLES